MSYNNGFGLPSLSAYRSPATAYGANGAYGAFGAPGPGYEPSWVEQEARHARAVEQEQAARAQLEAALAQQQADEQRRKNEAVEREWRRLQEEQERQRQQRLKAVEETRAEAAAAAKAERAAVKAKTKAKAEAKVEVIDAQIARESQDPTPTAVAVAPEPTVTPTNTSKEGDKHMATTTTSTTPDPKTTSTDTKVSTVMDWTKRAFAAGTEGAKDGAALVAAETLTSGVIAALSVEAPIILTIYNNSALAQKLMQVLVPYCLGLAATMGWLPQSELVAALCERALRAAISGNIGPLFARFKVPVMRVVESAMRDTADADRFNNATRVG